MTAKEELLQYKYARKKVDEALEEYEKYKTRAEKMTTIISDMPRSTINANKVEDNAVEMADISRGYKERWLEAEKEKLEVEQKIEKVEEPYRTILHKRYVEELNFEKIADEMGYTYNSITHMHGDALKLYKKIQDNTTLNVLL